MNQFNLISLIFAAELFGFSGCRRMIWNQRTSIGDARNWEENAVPCSSDALLFPQKSYDLIKLSNFSMKEIILPKTGGFILDSQTALQFTERDSKCRANQTRTFRSVIETPWLMTNNWNAARDVDENDITDFYNKATPHEELLPCDNDEIIFPINNSYVVDLQSAPALSFKSIAIDGRVLSLSEFKDFLFSARGQSDFKNVDNTLFEESSCSDDSKCVCHQKSAALLEQLCENEAANCRGTPHCSDPVKPIGHCCYECGALFQMNLDTINNFNLKSFKARIAQAVNATSGIDPDGIVYHISVVSKDRQLYLQLIIVDRFEYDELSTKLMDSLRQSILSQLYQKQSKFYFVSGLPFTPNESGHVLAFVFGSFFVVTLFMTLIYAVYYDDRHIPRFIAAIRNRRFLHVSDVTFARFDNASHVNGHEDSAGEVDLHFGTDQSIENLNSAFNNPMFDENIRAEDGAKGFEEVELKED